MTAYKWGFDMVGVNSVHSLTFGAQGPDAVILTEEDDGPPSFYFSSQHLNDLATDGEIRSRGLQLKTLFDGALVLDHGFGYAPEPMHELWAMDRFSRRGCPDPTPGVGAFSPAQCAKPLSRLEMGAITNRLVDGSIYAARTDQVVRDILETLGAHGITWISLYALTDTMKTSGLGEDAQAAAAGVSKTEYKLFKRTANSFPSIGVAARHGHTKDQPPPTPMTLERGAEIVLAAVRAFVKKRNRRAIAAASVATGMDAAPAALVVRPTPNSTRTQPVAPAPAAEPSEEPTAAQVRLGMSLVKLVALSAAALAIPAAMIALLFDRRNRGAR